MATNSRDVELDVEIEEIEEAGPNLFQKVSGSMRFALMVGLGAADFSQEKAIKLLQGAGNMVVNLEERGEKVSEQRREQVEDEVEKRQERIKTLSGKATDSFDKYSEAVLTRANIPTAEDVEGLSKQVSSLSRKVDKIGKQQKQAAA